MNPKDASSRRKSVAVLSQIARYGLGDVSGIDDLRAGWDLGELYVQTLVNPENMGCLAPF